MSDDQHDKYKGLLRGNQDVFLADIRRSDEFHQIEDKHLSKVFLGIERLLHRVVDEDENSGGKVYACAEEVSNVFRISKDTALNLLLTERHPFVYGHKYRPRISRDGDEVVLRIGPKTTQADIKSVWKIVRETQKEIGALGSKTSINPELAFCIHRQYVLRGRTMKDIFDDYTASKLDGYLHPPTIIYEDEFRKYYNRVIKGV